MTEHVGVMEGAPARPVLRMLVAADVAKLLRVSEKQLRNMLARGQFPNGKRLPGFRGPRWSPAAVDAWIAKVLETA